MTNAIESNVMEKPNNFENRKADKSKHNSLYAHPGQIAALKDYLSTILEVDKARVDFFKEEIASGRYEISSEHIADKMIVDIEMA